MWMFGVITFGILLIICCQVKWPRYLYLILKTFRRDIRFIWILTKTKLAAYMALRNNPNVFKAFSNVAKKYPTKNALLFEDEVWTFAMIENYANKVANYFGNEGYQKGDCVCLILDNCPEYICFWLGLSKLGVVTALINTSLVNRPLVHSINIVNCRGIIFGSNFAEAVSGVKDNFKCVKYYEFNRNNAHSGASQFSQVGLKEGIENTSGEDISNSSEIKTNDSFLYIYTSGTTGLPKAAVVTHSRYLTFTCFMRVLFSKRQDVIMYSPMPLYHASGSVLPVSFTLFDGATTVMRKKFSASNYWKDCAKYNCNVAQYIGEMCRYILAAPCDQNIKHQVKTMLGNGLQPKIWKTFVEKFKIDQVLEIYGATEGIANMINLDNTVGSVGSIPIYLRNIFPIAIIKYDERTGAPIRDTNGRCVRCKPNVTGIVIGKIIRDGGDRDFKGYLDAAETNKKILLDVFVPGDMYFNSGDVLINDDFGYFYFKDRIGDTFRWKGENVSTVEVEAVISSGPNLNDAAVYGVEIPGTEGRAGMAALSANNQLNLDVLAKYLTENLPSYAVPIFIRIVGAVPITGTMKLQKFELQREGFDINVIKDKIYFFSLGKYVEITMDLYNNIIEQKMRL